MVIPSVVLDVPRRTDRIGRVPQRVAWVGGMMRPLDPFGSVIGFR